MTFSYFFDSSIEEHNITLVYTELYTHINTFVHRNMKQYRLKPDSHDIRYTYREERQSHTLRYTYTKRCILYIAKYLT